MSGALTSVLTPFSDGATRIATLSWVIFVGAALIMLLVGGALWLAMSNRTAARRWLATSRSVTLLGIVFPVMTLTILLNTTLLLMRNDAAQGDAAGIEVTGEQYWWRISYGEAFQTANEIRIPVGQATTLRLLSRDVIHSFWVPSLGGKMDMFPERPTTITLAPDRPGTFRGVCAEFCGTGHAFMSFTVIAMPQADYDEWRRRQTAPALQPATDAARQGRALFEQAGCGTCHTVRGTNAAGMVGPDLTHLGSRNSIGADTLAMTEENLAAFVADANLHKPGNLMPPFRTLGDTELRALATYLAGLK